MIVRFASSRPPPWRLHALVLVAAILFSATAHAQNTLTGTIKRIYRSADPVAPFLRRDAASLFAPGAAVVNAVVLDIAGTRALNLTTAIACRASTAETEPPRTGGFAKTFAPPLDGSELQLLFGLAPATAAAVRGLAVTVRNAHAATMSYNKSREAFGRAAAQPACSDARRSMVVRTITADVEISFTVDEPSAAALAADLSRHLRTDADETVRRGREDVVMVLKERLIAITLE